ncbi:hypothetical protein FACS1894109_18010 [Spirochaetia bacterium]|nr:hypothetical protein FACS1894109_18010 [Spirochaetia bacterium]
MRNNGAVIFILLCFCAAGCRTAGGIAEGKPNWIQKPENAFNPAYYICGIGSGSSQEEADANAFANLISYFGQSVESNIQSVQVYKETINGNSESLQLRDEISSEIKLSSSMNQLIGAKIYDRWNERVKQNQRYYAIAVMEKSELIRIYTQLINDNLVLIEKFIALDSAEKTTINAVARYYCAADIADANAVFKNVLMVLGVSHQGAGDGTGHDYRLSAEKIIAQIPIAITVKGDIDGRISKAFAQVFSKRGFKTSVAAGTASADRPYTLSADFKMEDAPVTDSQYQFTRFVLTAAFMGKDGAELLSFSETGREGHITQSDALQRAIRSAEIMITEDSFAREFAAYLDSLRTIPN